MLIRKLNGYRVIYKPDHFNTMKSDNWDGYVYEHIYIMEIKLGRSLNEDEVVHHLDGNRGNNKLTNLLLINNDMHGKLHAWIDNGCNYKTPYEETCCINCGIFLYSSDSSKFCSTECKRLFNYNEEINDNPSKKPSNKEDLLSLLKIHSYTQVGKMFNVSDNAVRKWVKSYGIDPKTVRPKSNKTIKVYDQLDSDNVNAKKLNEEQVKEIKLLYKNFDNFDVNKVAKYYNVTVHSIHDIIKNRTWKGIRID